MSKPTFKERFKKLLEEAEDLIKNTPNDEIEETGVSILEAETDTILKEVECSTLKEFNQRMLERVTGVHGEYAYILKYHNELSEESVEQHRNAAAENGRYFTLPSIVTPPTRLNSKTEDYSQAYIAVFTHDKKALLVPFEGEAFSDLPFLHEEEIEFVPDF